MFLGILFGILVIIVFGYIGFLINDILELEYDIVGMVIIGAIFGVGVVLLLASVTKISEKIEIEIEFV